ncbi:hypothetical protein [Nocardioides sp.]|jgi:hemerythrin superfamily protein|uniref:hypothetical protein n=1 Tax=Nocardioides sp. TaxID=35761 RepID=UPI002F3E1EA6
MSIVSLSAALTREHREIDNGIEAFVAKLEQHNSKEEPIIYPRADSALTEEASVELAAFLRSGNLPDGWVCATAQ